MRFSPIFDIMLLPLHVACVNKRKIYEFYLNDQQNLAVDPKIILTFKIY